MARSKRPNHFEERLEKLRKDGVSEKTYLFLVDRLEAGGGRSAQHGLILVRGGQRG